MVEVIEMRYIFIALSVILIISMVACSRREFTQPRSWVIEMAIFPTGSTGNSYFIQIDESGAIKVSFGVRNELRITMIDEDFFSEMDRQKESILTENELHNLLTLAQELEGTGILETDISLGSWEVVLKYNGNIYTMDYWASNFEPLERLVDEIMRLSPLPVELHSWS